MAGLENFDGQGVRGHGRSAAWRWERTAARGGQHSSKDTNPASRLLVPVVTCMIIK